jgi:hydroxyacylglutathione hydrolase
MKPNGEFKPRSVGALYHVGGEGITHPLDANTYVINGRDPIMIECGSRLGYPQLKRELGKIGLQVADIKVVLATHGDWDHVSGFELMSEESDAELYVPTEDVAAVESGDDILTEAVYYGETANPIKVTGAVDDGFRLKVGTTSIRAIKTPWHTPGSVSYAVDQSDSSTLITGDTLWGYYFLNRSVDIDDDVRLGKDSFRHLRKEPDFDYLSFGHKVVGFMGDVNTRLEEAERQFAPVDLRALIEEEHSTEYVNPWRKVPGQIFKY